MHSKPELTNPTMHHFLACHKASVQLLAEGAPTCPICRAHVSGGELSAYPVNTSLLDIIPLAQQARQAESNSGSASHETGQEAFRVGLEQVRLGRLFGSGGQAKVCEGTYLHLDHMWIQ
jgi:hypothetical protein